MAADRSPVSGMGPVPRDRPIPRWTLSQLSTPEGQLRALRPVLEVVLREVVDTASKGRAELLVRCWREACAIADRARAAEADERALEIASRLRAEDDDDVIPVEYHEPTGAQ